MPERNLAKQLECMRSARAAYLETLEFVSRDDENNLHTRLRVVLGFVYPEPYSRPNRLVGRGEVEIALTRDVVTETTIGIEI